MARTKVIRRTAAVLGVFLFGGWGVPQPAAALPTSSAKHEQRQASRRAVEQHPFSSFGQDYIDAKNFITDKLGLQVGLDISYTAQRLSPSGKQTAIQGMYYPYITWALFQDKAWGSGAVNFNYN